MKFLVFSDSHGSAHPIRKALFAHPDAEAAVFLGDGAGEAAEVFRDFPHLAHCILPGNCDSSVSLAAHGLNGAEETVLDFGGKRFFCLHGHTRGAKSGYGRMLLRASELQADAVLFGHTHIPVCETDTDPGDPARRILLFNPGSVGMGYSHPYGVIYVVNGVISAHHGKADVR